MQLHLQLVLCQGVVLIICVAVFTASVLALGTIVSFKPLDDLRYKGLTGEQNGFNSPYASSVYLGWAMASAVALVVTGVLPIVSWFATYRFSLSSAVCVGIFTGNLSNILSLDLFPLYWILLVLEVYSFIYLFIFWFIVLM